MVKIELVKNKGSVSLHFETRMTTPEGLDELDIIYQALMGSEPKEAGYTDSNRFVIEVKNADA